MSLKKKLKLDSFTAVWTFCRCLMSSVICKHWLGTEESSHIKRKERLGMFKILTKTRAKKKIPLEKKTCHKGAKTFDRFWLLCVSAIQHWVELLWAHLTWPRHMFWYICCLGARYGPVRIKGGYKKRCSRWIVIMACPFQWITESTSVRFLL